MNSRFSISWIKWKIVWKAGRNKSFEYFLVVADIMKKENKRNRILIMVNFLLLNFVISFEMEFVFNEK